MTSLTDTTASFGSLHFGEAQLGDVRRTRRSGAIKKTRQTDARIS